MFSLTKLEQQVLDLFLAGNHPALEALRAQREAVTVASRDYTGVGVYVYFSVPETAACADPPDMVFGDVNLELSNAEPGVAVLLFVDGGRLHCLEFVTAAGPWPDVPAVREVGYLKEVAAGPNGFSLEPCASRDPQTLARTLRGRHPAPQ